MPKTFGIRLWEIENMTVTIEAVPCDKWKEYIAELVAVHSSAYEEWNGSQSEEHERRKADDYVHKWASFQQPLVLVARVGGRAVAYVVADERHGGVLHIAHIGVRRDFKRQGIGRALLRKVEEHAKSEKRRAVTTTTFHRFRGMLILLLQEGFYIQGTSWVEGAKEPMISLRKDMK